MRLNHFVVALALMTTPLSTFAAAPSYQDQLKNKYLILNGATCAGLQFNAGATAAAWQNEMECTRNYINKDAWRITWVSPDVFFMTEVIRPNEISPPRNDIYKITGIKNNSVNVINYWSGWGKSHSDKQVFHIQQKKLF